VNLLKSLIILKLTFIYCESNKLFYVMDAFKKYSYTNIYCESNKLFSVMDAFTKYLLLFFMIFDLVLLIFLRRVHVIIFQLSSQF